MIPIERLGAITPLEQPEQAAKLAAPASESLFSTIFQSAIQNVKDTNSDVEQTQYLLATGQLDNPSTALIAMTKYETSVSLLIQLRNRAMDAYSELTRLSF